MIGFEAKQFLTTIIKKFSKTHNEKILKIVTHKDEEDKLLNDKAFPFVSLLTADGDFDERFAKTVHFNKRIPQSLYPDEYKRFLFNIKEEDKEAFSDSYSLNTTEDLYLINDLSDDEKKRLNRIMSEFGYNKGYSIDIRGAIKCPVEIRVWTEKERDSNTILKNIIRNIPLKWYLDYYEGKIMIARNGSSDWISSRNQNVTSNLRGCVLSYCYVDFYMDIGTDPVEIPTASTIEFVETTEEEEDND